MSREFVERLKDYFAPCELVELLEDITVEDIVYTFEDIVVDYQDVLEDYMRDGR